MSEAERYTLEEAQKEFAKRTNGQVWSLLEKENRTPEEDHEMAYAAIASLYHWRHAGTEVHRQRGEWLAARVYTVLGEPKLALKHANRCLDITKTYKSQMKDFDIAYAYEALARANALAGKGDAFRKYVELAESAGEAIAGAEDKKIFKGDFEGGIWYGFR